MWSEQEIGEGMKWEQEEDQNRGAPRVENSAKFPRSRIQEVPGKAETEYWRASSFYQAGSDERAHRHIAPPLVEAGSVPKVLISMSAAEWPLRQSSGRHQHVSAGRETQDHCIVRWGKTSP